MSLRSVVFPHPGRGEDEGVGHLPVVCDPGKYLVRAAAHLMGDADVHGRDMLQVPDMPVLHDHLAGQPHSVPALDGDKPLPHLLLVGVEGVIAGIVHSLPQIPGCHDIGACAPRDPLPAAAADQEGLSGPQPDLLDPACSVPAPVRSPGAPAPEECFAPVRLSSLSTSLTHIYVEPGDLYLHKIYLHSQDHRLSRWLALTL